MSYYHALGLTKEPFSTSPDPDFFFLSREHKAAFYRLQVSIELRRGLSLILGDVGTGKTTLSRKLARTLSRREDVDFHMILNPYFKTEQQFLSRLARLFRIPTFTGESELDLIESVERSLFDRGVEQNRIVVLLMDEAQILPDFVFEILRILLNYETNEHKILQVVLVGQLELLPRISQIHNFWDRIAMKYVINPLEEEEIKEAIDYRLRQAGYASDSPLFTDGAISWITEHTQGYPRRLALLCHNCLEHLVMFDKKVVDEAVVRSVADKELKPVKAAGTGSVVTSNQRPVIRGQ